MEPDIAIREMKRLQRRMREGVTFDETLFASLNMAIEALEKQIPKRPILESWSPALCPSCSAELSELVGDGCDKHWYNKKICDCGQKLDWSEN